MLSDFKKFILRGNVVDLAVGVVIGTAFGAVVTALVQKLIMPLVGAVVGKPSFDDLTLTLHHSVIYYGTFLTALVNFLLIASAIFFFVVLPMNHLLVLAARRKTPADPTTKKCDFCLSEIPVEATRCAFCTSTLKIAKAKK